MKSTLLIKFKKGMSLSLLLILVLCFTFSSSQTILAGKKAPSTDAYVNLANTDYTTDDTTMKYKIYTNVCFTGVTKMHVYVSSVSVNNPNAQRNSTNFYCYLYNTKTKNTTKYKLSEFGNDSFYFKNLNSSTKYYIYFVKTDDTN